MGGWRSGGRPSPGEDTDREQNVAKDRAHPGYIPWEEFETNQATLVANANGYGPDRRCSPPREGVALLQGLAICGRCGHRMTVRYSVRHGHPVPIYVCQRQGIALAQPSCQTIPGAGLDDAVARVVLDAITPAALDVALEVFDELRARQAEVDRLRRAQVERAREEAELAQRQFLLVRPEHRLVADSLERQGAPRQGQDDQRAWHPPAEPVGGHVQGLAERRVDDRQAALALHVLHVPHT